MFIFQKDKKSNLRRGKLKTNHGFLKTPFFMPDATRGFVKLSTTKDVLATKTAAMVVNTFHLYLQPGLELIKKAGGIHGFMSSDLPLLSDSGGFQVFSLIHRSQKMGRIDDQKVTFKSPLDGSYHELSPEKSIQIQFILGTDMIVCLDDCPPNEFSREQMEKSVERTLSWAKRCKDEYLRQVKKRKLTEKNRPLLFSVVQGGVEVDLRRYCASELAKIGFDGYGFGARPVDKNGNFLAEILFETAKAIPENSLRFALGVGTPEDIYRCALMGWDMFDCVIPTREGRHGKLFYFKKNFSGFKLPQKNDGPVAKAPDFYQSINISNAIFAKDFSPINKNSKIPELRTYSKAFLHHLFRLNEPLGQRLAAANNLEFFQDLLTEIRLNK
ncbi:MAG: tRNA guanosine(34) transglycosylase Tgt [Candidatus Falkowbacteria bacterium]|nr:tRNA guanosine(34) transglycosylase Tgt [Candidatus Falkowbacteria bacterium]